MLIYFIPVQSKPLSMSVFVFVISVSDCHIFGLIFADAENHRLLIALSYMASSIRLKMHC